MLKQQTTTNPLNLSYRTASILTAASLLVIGLVLYVWFELAAHSMLYPWVATLGIAAFFAVPALVLLWGAPWRIKIGLIGVFLLAVLLIRNLDWNSRKPFLRGLDSIQPGMTVEQVDSAMRFFRRAPDVGVSEYGTVNYRHTDEGWGNADIGVVTFVDGLVTRVQYLPD